MYLNIKRIFSKNWKNTINKFLTIHKIRLHWVLVYLHGDENNQEDHQDRPQNSTQDAH